MAKRLSGTDKWDKAWFRKLTPRHKTLWEFLRDKCDHAGVWEVDFESASHFINDVKPITKTDLEVFGRRVEWIREDKIWLVDFVYFQCGELKETCPAHKPVIKLLKKYSLLDRVCNTQQEIEIEKEKEGEEEKEKGVQGEKYPSDYLLVDELFMEYCERTAGSYQIDLKKCMNEWDGWYCSKFTGWREKLEREILTIGDLKKSFETWLINPKSRGKPMIAAPVKKVTIAELNQARR